LAGSGWEICIINKSYQTEVLHPQRSLGLTVGVSKSVELERHVGQSVKEVAVDVDGTVSKL
jgi:hypothetical protein